MKFSPVRLDAAHETMRSQVRAFLGREAGERGFDGLGMVSGHDQGFSRRLAAEGYVGMALPLEYGGHERTAVERFVVVEELLAAGAPMNFHWIADRQTGPMIARFGTPEQRARFLPPIARGELGFAIGMSEPDAGSDLAAVASDARQVEGGWLLNGTKIWTSGATEVGWVLVLCRTSPRGKDRHEGLSQLIVALDSPGVEVRTITFIDGTDDFTEVVFTDVFVPDDLVLGSVGMGWAQVTSELGFERAGPDRYMSSAPLLEGFAQQLHDEGLDDRRAETLGGLAARWWAIRQLSLSVARMISDHEAPHAEAALVKDLGTTYEQEVIDVVLRELAPELDAGASSRFERLLARATLIGPSYTIRGGTTEVLRSICARHLGAGPLFTDALKSDDLVTSTVAQMLEPFASPVEVAEAEATLRPSDRLWKLLQESQMLGIGVDEHLGGSGGTVQQGLSVVPLSGMYCAYAPFAEASLAAWMLAAAGIGIPAGETITASLADAAAPLQVDGAPGALRVSGVLQRVPWASAADRLVTLAEIDGVVHTIAVPLASAVVEPGSNLAGEPRDRVVLDRVALDDASVAPTSLTAARVQRRGAFLRSLQIAGACEGAVNLGLRYASEREQFGKQIKTFQAVQQHLVRAAGEVALARIACEVATALVDSEDEAFATAVANVVARRAARIVTAAMHQTHGAIGVTREYALQLFTRRLWSWQQEFGGEGEWSRQLGQHIAEQPGEVWPMIATGLVGPEPAPV